MLPKQYTKVVDNFNVVLPLLILPNSIWILLGLHDGRLAFVSLIYIFSFIYYCKYPLFRKIASSFPMSVWLVLTLYHLINATVKYVPGINYVDYLCGLKIYASICIFTFFFSIETKRTAKLLFLWIGAWFPLALMTIKTEYTVGERLGNDSAFVSVQYGKHAALMGIMALYYSAMNQTRMLWMLVKLVYPMAFILLAQTRNAFGMVIIQFLGYYYAFVLKCKVSAKHILLVVAAASALWLSTEYVIENTALGSRFVSDIEDVDEGNVRQNYMTGTFFDYIAGERIIYYATGWEIFTEHPITGIGLDNYQNYMGGDYPMHVEYMKHLAEGGIIAAALWLTFIITLFVYVLKTNINRPQRFMAISTLGVILFMSLFSVSYEQELPVILYSLILAVKHPTHGNFYAKNSDIN